MNGGRLVDILSVQKNSWNGSEARSIGGGSR